MATAPLTLHLLTPLRRHPQVTHLLFQELLEGFYALEAPQEETLSFVVEAPSPLIPWASTEVPPEASEALGLQEGEEPLVIQALDLSSSRGADLTLVVRGETGDTLELPEAGDPPLPPNPFAA